LTRDQLMSITRSMSLAALRGEDPVPALKTSFANVGSHADAASPKPSFLRQTDATKVREAIARRATNDFVQGFDDEMFKRTGLKLDHKNPRSMVEMFKMGIRVERVTAIDAERAWAAVTGRNFDASEYRYSALLRRRSSGWKMVVFAHPDDEKTCPELWPLSMFDYEAYMAREIELETKVFGPVFKKAR
jgi:hypothetical protein